MIDMTDDKNGHCSDCYYGSSPGMCDADGVDCRRRYPDRWVRKKPVEDEKDGRENDEHR